VIPNHFAQLPSELQLRVFSSLVVLHELEHAQCQAQGRWTVLKASSSRNQWVGQERGMRELVKFSRVSVVIVSPFTLTLISPCTGVQSMAGFGVRWAVMDKS
jgi:hypothetical protein